MSEICTYGEGAYGDGHYGVCDLVNVRGCAPLTNRDSTPVTTTTAYDPSCNEDREC